ncbi:hypothetical protein SNARM312S_06043 [Streptomyces narbonensis]
MSPRILNMSDRLATVFGQYGAGMDVLSDAIAVMRTGRPHSSRTVRFAPWGFRFSPSRGAGFHVVLQGTAWLLPPEGDPVRLGAGDVVLLAHGTGHGLADRPDTPLVDALPASDGSWPTPPDRGPIGADETLLLCGAYQLSRARAHPLLTELPPTSTSPPGSVPTRGCAPPSTCSAPSSPSRSRDPTPSSPPSSTPCSCTCSVPGG